MIPGIGQAAKGAQRWISLGPLGTLQPSEPAKLATLFVLAYFLSGRLKGWEGFRPRLIFQGLLLIGIPFALIAKQPDLGTSLVILACGFVMLYQSGASLIHLAGLVAAGLGILPLVLKEYQRTRLLVFLNPETDPQGAGYNIMQSITAVGSGGWFGKGLFQGPLSQNGFVPENRTDFIITVLGEELGL
jgi:rod shape determining protein RodA